MWVRVYFHTSVFGAVVFFFRFWYFFCGPFDIRWREAMSDLPENVRTRRYCDQTALQASVPQRVHSLVAEEGKKLCVISNVGLNYRHCRSYWFQTNSCPLCRFELPTDDPMYEEMKKQKKRSEQRKQDIEQLHDSMFGWIKTICGNIEFSVDPDLAETKKNIWKPFFSSCLIYFRFHLQWDIVQFPIFLSCSILEGFSFQANLRRWYRQ